MNDVDVQTAICTALDPIIAVEPSLPAGMLLLRSNQRDIQGANTGAAFYFVKVADRRHGFLQRKNVWNPDAGRFDVQLCQVVESTWQFTGQGPQAPDSPSSESDWLETLSSIIQGDDGRAALKAHGLGMLRITDVRNPYYVDDRDQFAAAPSFDVVLTYTRTRVATAPAVSTVNAGIYRV